MEQPFPTRLILDGLKVTFPSRSARRRVEAKAGAEPTGDSEPPVRSTISVRRR